MASVKTSEYWFYTLQWDDHEDIRATLNQQIKAGYASLKWKNGHGVAVKYNDGSSLQTTKNLHLGSI
jgi:hypothetical protein